MSSRKKTPVRLVAEPMDDEPGPSTQSQRVSKGRKVPRLPPDEENRKAADIVRYLVCYDTKKVPIKKKSIIDDVLGKDYSSNFEQLMKKAKKKLKMVFGLRCVQVHHASQKCYILTNNLRMGEAEGLVDWSLTAAQMGLLFVVLSVIMMMQTAVPEETLWSLLKELKVFKDKKHAEFGDVTRLITSEFVHQLYLSVEKKTEGEKRVNYYSWGERARYEVDKDRMLAFVAELHGGSYEMWKERYQNILAGEEPDVGDTSSDEDEEI